MKKTIVTAILCTFVTAGAGANFQQDFKICSPHKIIVDDIVGEIEELRDQDLNGQIQDLRFQKSEKENEIHSIANSVSSARSRANQLESRLQVLTTKMGQLQKAEKSKIRQAQNEVVAGQKERAHNQMKKDGCKSGIRGTFCRKKYRSRIKKAEQKVAQAQQKKARAQKVLVNLPKEKAALPAKIARVQADVSSLQGQLTSARTAKPTVVQLRKKIDHLEERNRNLHVEIDNLEADLGMAEKTLGSCQKMKKLAKAYKVLQRKAAQFKAEPVLCDNVDTMIDMADKAFQKKGINDAHKIVCEGSEVIGDDFQVSAL